MNKLFKNYSQSLWLVRIAFVLLSMYVNYSLSSYYMSILGYSDAMYILLLSLLSAMLSVLLLPWFVGVLLNLFRIFYVPVNEYKLLAIFCCCISLAIQALGKLLIMVIPFAGVWITVLAYIIGLTVAMIIFYLITSKLYTNDTTRPYYLRSMLFVYALLFVVGV